jgi:general secretion pathway protein D
VADIRTSQLVVVGTKKELVDVENMIQHLDTATKQVLIEARMVETSMNPKTSKGVDWTGTVGAQKVTFGNGVTVGQETRTSVSQPVNQSNANPGGVNNTVQTVLNSIMGNGGLSLNTARGLSPATAFLNADGVSAVLSFINNYSESRVISCPRTVTLDNETAHIAVTRASPIINITPGTVQVAGGSTISYTNLGVILDVTPRISANSFVNLKVVPEVSRIADTVTKIVNDGTFIVDEYDMRRIDTHVMIPSGNTLVLGGLVSDDVNNGNIKVPILGDIPGLGPLFRKDTKERRRSNLIVFITPTIVQDEDYQPTASTYLHTPVPTKDSVDEKDWSAWNSGKPLWSKKYKGYDASKNPEAGNK